MDDAKTGPKSELGDTMSLNSTPSLEDLGIHKKQSSRWQQIALSITKRTQQALSDKEQTQRKLGRHGGDRKSEEVKNQGDDSHLEITRGTGNADYLLDRIERDFPETYQDIKDGKFRSTRQAAISVGKGGDEAWKQSAYRKRS